MIGELIDLTGQRFGRLTVLRITDEKKHGTSKWLCKCDCGKEVIVFGSNLRSNHTRSCGCLSKEMAIERFTTHGQRKSRTYKTYHNMIRRCTNPKHDKFHVYGGRGIKVCNEWLESFDNFYRDMGDRPEGKTLDRIDVNGNYCKENCRWATKSEQGANLQHNFLVTYDGKTQTLPQWSKELNLPLMTLRNRLLTLHWSVERALTTPPRRKVH